MKSKIWLSFTMRNFSFLILFQMVFLDQNEQQSEVRLTRVVVNIDFFMPTGDIILYIMVYLLVQLSNYYLLALFPPQYKLNICCVCKRFRCQRMFNNRIQRRYDSFGSVSRDLAYPIKGAGIRSSNGYCVGFIVGRVIATWRSNALLFLPDCSCNTYRRYVAVRIPLGRFDFYRLRK